jgi:DNA-binding CsgD family transcriptional regulator
MLTAHDYERLVDATLALHDAVDLREFPRHAIEAARKLVDNDVCGYAEVDTVALHAATVSDNDAWLSSSLVDTWAEQTLGDEILPYWRQFTPGQVIKFSDFVSIDELKSKQIYQEFYREVDILYQMVVPFVCERGVVLSMGFSRSGSVRRDFNETERELLLRFGPHLARAYRAAEAYDRAKRGKTISDIDLSRTETGLILLTSQGNVSAACSNARKWATEFFGNFPAYSARLPATLWQWVRRVLAQRDAARRSGALVLRSPLIERREDRQIEVSLVDGLDGLGPALVFQHHSFLRPDEVARILRTSPREAEVVRWLLQGKSNEEIADILGISPRTVQTHLQRIYQKLGVSSRTQAIAAIRGFLHNY